jgi:16S rRNA (cytidine1402-2'-O)-methyltransferase
MGTLYLIPTPIGNLEDMTLRGIRLLKEVDLILAEDTRTSGILLKHYGIETKKQSYHIFNEHKTAAGLVDRIEKGENMALISDAGTPSISDPGFLLVRTCLERNVRVECLPGATAFVPALVKSGLPSDRFIFEGFLPHKKGRATRLNQLVDEKRTIILYESPHRLAKTLKQLKETLGDRQASVSRELTKIHEETRNGRLSELFEHFSNIPPKGEIVIVIQGGE